MIKIRLKSIKKWNSRLLGFFEFFSFSIIATTFFWILQFSPLDYQQLQAAKIMHIHVPSAWIALGAYTCMFLCSLVYLVIRSPLFDLIAESIAPVGALFTFITLITGSLWGKPIWGTWWVWDARLTSVFILFLFYIGYILIRETYKFSSTGALMGGILTIVGFINIPIIKFSVEWWNTLHQPASIMRFKSPAMHADFLWPLLSMALGFSLLAVCLVSMIFQLKYTQRRAYNENR